MRGIYIDDTATPGVKSKSRFLPENRRSYCAVVVTDAMASNINRLLQIFLNGIKEDYGASELHCTDLYSGRGPWKGVSPSKRMEVFDLMLMVLEKCQLPIIFQTWSEISDMDHPDLKYLKTKDGVWWDFRKTDHKALLFLCFRVAKLFKFLQKENAVDFSRPLPAFIDEGLAKNETSIELPNWEYAFQGKRLKFVRSKDNPGIQIADFAAFTIARAQWVSSKVDRGNTLTKADSHILEASGKLNCINLVRVPVDLDTFTRESYEFVLMKDRKEKSLPAISNRKR